MSEATRGYIYKIQRPAIGGNIVMKFPPKPKTPYILDEAQDKRIFRKLGKFSKKRLDKTEESLIKFLYSQLEKDWQTPLEKFIDRLLK